MLTEREIEAFGFGHEAIFKDLEKAIMSDIVRRIRQTDVITRSADFQLNHLKMLGMSDYEIKKMAEQYIQASDDYLDRVFANAIETDYIDNKELYKAQGKEFIPFEDNEMIQQWIQAIKLQTKDEMRRLTESMGFVVQTGSRKVVQPVGVFYQNVLDQSVVDIMMGTFDYNRVLNDAVRKMTYSGLRWIDYQSGWHNRVTVAARRAVMTGISQITMQISEMNANELGTDYFEVTAHANARPSHAEWQGKVYSRKELETVCHLGEVTGLLGANCYHMYYPFVPGVSKRAYTDDQLDEWKSDKPIEYNGKEYNGYEATQRMRQMETNMRAQREKIYLLKQGEDEIGVNNAKVKYQIQMDQYRDFVKAMGLKQQKERIYGDGLGKLGTSSKLNLILNDIQLPKSVGARWSNYDIMDLDTRDYFKFVEGTKIQNVEVFAGKGVKTPFRDAKKYAKLYGGKPEDWKHVKGIALLDTDDGPMKAEIHWVQCPGIGKFDMFVKEWLE